MNTEIEPEEEVDTGPFAVFNPPKGFQMTVGSAREMLTSLGTGLQGDDLDKAAALCAEIFSPNAGQVSESDSTLATEGNGEPD